jgi:hypothetical protein
MTAAGNNNYHSIPVSLHLPPVPYPLLLLRHRLFPNDFEIFEKASKMFGDELEWGEE